MTNSLKCSHCNAELLPEAKFCRRCGASLESSNGSDSSELPTAVLSTSAVPATRELQSRSTSPEPALPPASFDHPREVMGTATGKRRSVLIGSAVFVFVLLVVVGSIAYVSVRNHSRTTDDAKLIYPGAKTVVDITSGDGRALQLQTSDSFDRVIAWYETSIKPTKTMRLTSTSVVLKNENVTTTVAAEDGKTNILIKRTKQ